jgi:hypothetical protein
LAIESAERTKLDANNGQNSVEAGCVPAFDVVDADLVRRKCCAMPMLKTVQITKPGSGKVLASLRGCQKVDAGHII